ncbi:hypothetical protein DXG01_004447 [Tephrocybe rancida]|nr:hypothetical protein DXG01_004447 [Tephrocybe rancida]
MVLHTKSVILAKADGNPILASSSARAFAISVYVPVLPFSIFVSDLDPRLDSHLNPALSSGSYIANSMSMAISEVSAVRPRSVGSGERICMESGTATPPPSQAKATLDHNLQARFDGAHRRMHRSLPTREYQDSRLVESSVNCSMPTATMLPTQSQAAKLRSSILLLDNPDHSDNDGNLVEPLVLLC